MANSNKKKKSKEIICKSCKSLIEFAILEKKALFCPFCGKPLELEGSFAAESSETQSTETFDSATLVKGHEPNAEIQFHIGNYQVIGSIGKGGMGEVLLAYDLICGRRIALKRIRSDLNEMKQIQNRFLKEARITSQLTHPAIIPIYSIHQDPKITYYTMPYVEGETLKQLLRRTRQQEKKGEKQDHIGSSIPALIRIFIAICQAVGYAHSKNVLHRDLKPENIIIGKYGEVLILDWGLAKIFEKDEIKFSEESQEFNPSISHHLTKLGKVVGTISYMAPERALGQSATVQTDIYSLGVILYQMLTLQLPFRRNSLKEFRAHMEHEVLIDPTEKAPYRDVPKILVTIVTKCLETDLEKRYSSVDLLIRDLENYIEGRTDWFKIAELNIKQKEDWEFQENILIAEHTAITRNSEISEWVSLMISKASFAENIRIEAKIFLGDTCQGIGFLLNIPEIAQREYVNDGYCLWIGSDVNKNTKLLKSSYEVLQAEEIFLPRKEWVQVKIEKMENSIHFYLNDILQFSYISRLPIVGTHVGLLSRDADFLVENFSIFVGSQNIMVNCLAIPDAFLAHRDYETALSEYRRIGYAFPGRAEGREAILRAGITLLEQAKSRSDPEESAVIFDASLKEFEKLHQTAGAPLEYLGKALVYQAMKETGEEIKCFELACRRYPKHPLLHILEEQAIFRMQESSRTDRQATYSFLLLTLRFIHRFQHSNPVQKLIQSLKKHWEYLPFLFDDGLLPKANNATLAIPLAFWLDKPFILGEIIDELSQVNPLPEISLGNAFFCLIQLGYKELALEKLNSFIHLNAPTFNILKIILETDITSLSEGIEKLKLKDEINDCKLRALEYFLDLALDMGKTKLVHEALEELGNFQSLSLTSRKITALLYDRNLQLAGEQLHAFPFEFLSRETSLLFYLYGLWLYALEGKEIAYIHFSGVMDVPYPRTFALGNHYLGNKLGENWFKQSFSYEKKQLERQLKLFEAIKDFHH